MTARPTRAQIARLALANMDAISSAIGPGGDPGLDEAPDPGVVIPAARLQAIWDRLLARTAQASRPGTARQGLTIAGYAEAEMYAQLVGFPVDEHFGAGNAVHRALEAGRPTPLLPGHVPPGDAAEGGEGGEGGE